MKSMKLMISKDGSKIINVYVSPPEWGEHDIQTCVHRVTAMTMLAGWYKDFRAEVIEADGDGLLAFLAANGAIILGDHDN